MSAEQMFHSLNRKAPIGKEKHHGNKRNAVPKMKQKMRKVDRRKLDKACQAEF